MSVLLITYDQTKLNLEVDPVPRFIKNYKHVQVSPTSFAIETGEKTRTIFNRLIPFLSKNAHLLIVTVMQPFAVQGSELAQEWLSKHLPED